MPVSLDFKKSFANYVFISSSIWGGLNSWSPLLITVEFREFLTRILCWNAYHNYIVSTISLWWSYIKEDHVNSNLSLAILNLNFKRCMDPFMKVFKSAALIFSEKFQFHLANLGKLLCYAEIMQSLFNSLKVYSW